MPEIDPSVLLAQAKSVYDGEEFVDAARLFQQAAQCYNQTGDPLAAAEALNNASVALLRAGKANEALETVAGTQQIFNQAGDKRREAMAFGNLGAAYDDLKQYPQALENYRLSADLLKSINERELRATVLQRISAIQLKQGKRLDSLLTMEAALDNQSRLSLKDRLLRGLIQIARSLSGK